MRHSILSPTPGLETYHDDERSIVIPITIELLFQECVEDGPVLGFAVCGQNLLYTTDFSPADPVPVRNCWCGARWHRTGG